MIDLHWTEGKNSKRFNCGKCPEKQQELNKCQKPGFQHFKGFPKQLQIDSSSLKYQFCPGKATWYPEIIECFSQCEIAMETGILPGPGLLEDQTPMFNEVFLFFLQRWKARRYFRVWADVYDFTPKVLEQIAKMFGSKKKGSAR